jgi:hypothetical protein
MNVVVVVVVVVVVNVVVVVVNVVVNVVNVVNVVVDKSEKKNCYYIQYCRIASTIRKSLSFFLNSSLSS